jgi:hypothetical protein
MRIAVGAVLMLVGCLPMRLQRSVGIDRLAAGFS